MKPKTLIRALRRGVAAAQAPPQPQRFKAAGKVVACSHCGNDGFDKAGLFGVTYAGYGLRCCRCNHLEFFGGSLPEEVKSG